MKQKLNAYVPAIEFTDEKELTPLRTHHEDLCVIDPNDQYRILAHRPAVSAEGATLLEEWSIPEDALPFLKTALASHSRAALLADGRAVLILGELYAASGVLLAIRPHLSPASLRRYAETYGLGDLVFSPDFPTPSTAPAIDEEEPLNELNYYLGQILTPRSDVNAATLVWRVASFVGCRLEHADPPSEELCISDAQNKRLTAYLLCVLLHLQAQGGRVFATDVTDATQPQFRYRIAYVDPEEDRVGEALHRLSALRFHKLPAFSDFLLRSQGNTLVMDAHLPLSPKSGALRADLPALFVLRLTLERL